MPQAINTDRQAEACTATGRHPVKGAKGLFLMVKPTGTKSWVFRVMVKGKRQTAGLGGFPTVSIDDARKLAADRLAGAKTAAPKPTTDKPTFAECAAIVAMERERVNGKPWASLASLKLHVFPVIGDTPIDRIDRPALARLFDSIAQAGKGATVRALRPAVRFVFKHAVAYGHRIDDPSAFLSEQGSVAIAKAGHRRGVSFRDAPAVYRVLSGWNGIEAAACVDLLRFIILTAARKDEARHARWSEIDMDAATWTIPAARMKSKRPHTVALSGEAMAILRGRKGDATDADFVFSGTAGAVGETSPNRLQRRIAPNTDVHGWRRTFKTWTVATGRDAAQVELCLAHAVTGDHSAVEGVYIDIDDLTVDVEPRRAIMEAWADHLTAP